MNQPTETPPGKTPDLDANDMLIAEFEYITQIAHNDSEDRARVSTFYLVSVGSIVAALLSTNLGETPSNSELFRLGFMGIFAMLTLMGWTTIFQLVRLRFSWARAIVGMNAIKEYYIAHFGEDMLGSTFKWRTDDKDKAPSFKRKSLGTIMVMQIGLVSSLTLCGAIVFFLLTFGKDSPTDSLCWIVLAGVVHFLLQTGYYILRLQKGNG